MGGGDVVSVATVDFWSLGRLVAGEFLRRFCDAGFAGWLYEACWLGWEGSWGSIAARLDLEYRDV